MEMAKLRDFWARERSNWRASFAEEIDKLIVEEKVMADDLTDRSQ